jgi:hypothetical protein
MDAMKRLMSGRTSFMIAHRLSTLDVCDARLEIDSGRTVRFEVGDAAPPDGPPKSAREKIGAGSPLRRGG